MFEFTTNQKDCYARRNSSTINYMFDSTLVLTYLYIYIYHSK